MLEWLKHDWWVFPLAAVAVVLLYAILMLVALAVHFWGTAVFGFLGAYCIAVAAILTWGHK